MRKQLSFSIVIFALLFGTSSAYAQPKQPTSKSRSNSLALPNIKEVLVFAPNQLPSDGVRVKLFASNSFIAKVKVGQKFQLVVAGLTPTTVSAVTIVSPQGLSANMTPTSSDDIGVLTLPYLTISKKGSYSVLIRQPEINKTRFLQIKVS